jgi:hypothetical protein
VSAATGCVPQGAKPQIAPNGGGHDLCAARLVALALRGEEVSDILRPYPRERKAVGGNEVSEEPANHWRREIRVAGASPQTSFA